jgi:twitching motility protein PilT
MRMDIINSNRGCNSITLEDPVEYLHQHKKSNIWQHQVGNDMLSF